MIRAEELRIDNLVEYNGIICKVSEIRSPKPFEDERFSGKFIIELFDGAGLITCTIDDINPIMLSEEKLLEFNFEKKEIKGKDYDEVQYSKQINVDVYIVFEDDFSCALFSSESREPIDIGVIPKWEITKTVHGLQNLIFALSGEELIK